jgi:hypothetical protein
VTPLLPFWVKMSLGYPCYRSKPDIPSRPYGSGVPIPTIGVLCVMNIRFGSSLVG